MPFYFILTTSAFLNWASEINTPITNASKKLLDKLKILSFVDKESKVMVVPDTDKSIRECADKEIWVYNLLRAFYDIETNASGDEINAIKNLALNKSRVFDKVIIINSSNAYQGEREIMNKENIEVMNEMKALFFVIRNCNL